MNSAMGPSFNENFVEKSTCGSREQCKGPIDRDAKVLKNVFSVIQTNTIYNHMVLSR